MSHLQSLLDEVAGLPALPDLAEVRRAAEAREELYARIVAVYSAELTKVRAELAVLGGTNPTRKRPAQRNVSEDTYKLVLAKLADHAYAGINTLASETTVSRGHVGQVLSLAEERGHVQRKDNATRRRRYVLTEAGLEFILPAEPTPVGVTPSAIERLPLPELDEGLRNGAVTH